MYTKQEAYFYNISMCLFAIAILLQSLYGVNALFDSIPVWLVCIASIMLCIPAAIYYIWIYVKNRALYQYLTSKDKIASPNKFKNFPMWAFKFMRYSICWVLVCSVIFIAVLAFR